MSSNNALIGYSGFVGGNLLRQQEFSAQYNSKNINEIRGKSFDTVICAGAPAAKWIANKEPEKDRANIDTLIEHLKTVKAETFVLISTVDVYLRPIEVDESSQIITENLHAYGSNRFYLEQFIKGHFKNHIILRLPGLYGFGLKKNVIFDFLNNNNLDKIESRGIFQFYNLEYLSRDIRLAKENGIQLVNIATAPVSVREIAKFCFDIEFIQELPAAPALYDFRTIHAKGFGKAGHYLYERNEVLEDMKKFVQASR